MNAPNTASPPVLRPRTTWAWPALALAFTGAALALALLFSHRPEGQFFFPRCTFHQLSGLHCPGCGGLRATHELLNGRLLDAARSNLIVVLLPPVLILAWCFRRRLAAVPLSSRTVLMIFGVLVLYTLLRNLPWPPFSWLAPAL
jgi:hypothetical protein